MCSNPGRADRPVLYSFRRCPYAIRARLALKGAGIAVTLREVRLRDKPAALLAASPRATVPVLQRPDGTVLDQSLDIMRWALRTHDPLGWLRDDETEAVDVLTTQNDGPFKRALDRYKYASRPLDVEAAASRDACIGWLQALDARLAGHRHLLRDTPSVADMAVLPFVRQFAAVDPAAFARQGLPRLQDWLARLTGSALFTAVMAKVDPWRQGDAEVVF